MHIIKQTEVPEYKNVNIEPSCRSLFIFPFYWIIIGGLHVGPALYFCHWAVWYGATLFLKMYNFKSQCNLNVCKHVYICFNTELWRLETLNTISASYPEVSVWVAVVFCTSVLALFIFFTTLHALTPSPPSAPFDSIDFEAAKLKQLDLYISYTLTIYWWYIWSFAFIGLTKRLKYKPSYLSINWMLDCDTATFDPESLWHKLIMLYGFDYCVVWTQRTCFSDLILRSTLYEWNEQTIAFISKVIKTC